MLALKVVAGQLHGGDQLYPVLPGVGIGVLGAEQGVVVRKGDGVQPGAAAMDRQPLDGHSTIEQVEWICMSQDIADLLP